MNPIKLIKKIENFELHHKVSVFIGIIVLTILFIRLGVSFYNPNPSIFNFELHHFDYGILLLMATTLLLLFNNRHYLLYLLLSAIAFGMVLDEFWFIRNELLNTILNDNNLSVYNATFPSVVLFVLGIILLTLLINHFRKRPSCLISFCTTKKKKKSSFH